MAKTKQTEEQTEAQAPTPGLDKYLKDFLKASKYVRDNYHEDWFNYWKAYNNIRTKIGYNSIADAFVPETRTIVESLVANIAGGQPKFEYVPTNEEQNTDTKVLSELINYYWDCNHMGTKAQSWVRDSIIYGNGILHVTWDGERNIPCIDNVPLRDFFVDPTATTMENARYAGFRYLTSKKALENEVVINPDWKEGDPEDNKFTSKYKNLDKVWAQNNPGTSPEEMDKANKELLLGSTVGDKSKDQIEVILMYYGEEGNHKLVEIANRATIIREIDTPYQQDEMEQQVEVTGPDGLPVQTKKTIDSIEPFMPFAILRNTIDSSLFFASGDVEVIIDRQETLNDIENLDLDNLHFINNVMWRIDPAYEDMASEVESTPGIVIPLPRFALEPIPKPAVTSDLDQKKQEIKDEMRRATGADEIIQGAQPENSRTTATEIAAVSNQASARFQTKVTNLEAEGFAQLGSILFKMSQIFVSPDTVVRIVGPEGVSFKDFDPYEFSGYYEPHVKLESTVKRQEQERGMKDNQLFQLLMNNPVVNQQEAIRMIGKSLGATDDELNRLLTPPAPVAPIPGMAPGAPAQPGQPQPGQQQVDPAQEAEMAKQAAQEDFAKEESQRAVQAAHEDFAKEQQK